MQRYRRSPVIAVLGATGGSNWRWRSWRTKKGKGCQWAGKKRKGGRGEAEVSPATTRHLHVPDRKPLLPFFRYPSRSPLHCLESSRVLAANREGGRPPILRVLSPHRLSFSLSASVEGDVSSATGPPPARGGHYVRGHAQGVTGIVNSKFELFTDPFLENTFLVSPPLTMMVTDETHGNRHKSCQFHTFLAFLFLSCLLCRSWVKLWRRSQGYLR